MPASEAGKFGSAAHCDRERGNRLSGKDNPARIMSSIDDDDVNPKIVPP